GIDVGELGAAVMGARRDGREGPGLGVPLSPAGPTTSFRPLGGRLGEGAREAVEGQPCVTAGRPGGLLQRGTDVGVELRGLRGQTLRTVPTSSSTKRESAGALAADAALSHRRVSSSSASLPTRQNVGEMCVTA